MEKTLKSPLDSKEIKPVNPKGSQSWIFIGRTEAEAEALILWPPDVKCWLTGKDPDAGKDWGQEEKGAGEDEMVGWHHWFNGQEFEQTLRDSEGQGSLMSWGCRESDTIDWTMLGYEHPHLFLSVLETLHLLWWSWDDKAWGLC